MKLKINIIVLNIFIFSCCINKKNGNDISIAPQSYSDSVCIKSSKEAIVFARRELEEIYSIKFTDKDAFEAEKIGDSIWVVDRVVPENMDGGVFTVKIRISDCKILSVYAGK